LIVFDIYIVFQCLSLCRMLQLFLLSKNYQGDHGGGWVRRGTWHVFVRRKLRAGLSWGNQKDGTTWKNGEWVGG